VLDDTFNDYPRSLRRNLSDLSEFRLHLKTQSVQGTQIPNRPRKILLSIALMRRDLLSRTVQAVDSLPYCLDSTVCTSLQKLYCAPCNAELLALPIRYPINATSAFLHLVVLNALMVSGNNCRNGVCCIVLLALCVKGRTKLGGRAQHVRIHANC